MKRRWTWTFSTRASRWCRRTSKDLLDGPDPPHPVEGVFAEYGAEQLDFLWVVGESPDLVEWLLEHSSTEELNRLLQVRTGVGFWG